jgi:hypothetical protein
MRTVSSVTILHFFEADVNLLVCHVQKTKSLENPTITFGFTS